MSELPTKEERKAFQRAPIWPFPQLPSGTHKNVYEQKALASLCGFPPLWPDVWLAIKI